MRTFIVALFCLTASLAQAENLDDFRKRFEFVRNEEGRLVEVRDRSMAKDVSLKAFVQGLRAKVKAGRSFLRSSDFDLQVDFLLDGMEELPEELERHEFVTRSISWRDILKKALESISRNPVERFFDDARLKENLISFERKLTSGFRLMGKNVVARPYDHDFFHKMFLTYEITAMALKIAERTISDVPLLHIVGFVMTNYEEMVRTRRHYHQNMLLHYLERIKPEELGLTDEEARFTISSIYESRLSWLDFKARKKAKADWDKFGTGELYSSLRTGTRLLTSRTHFYESLGERLNFAFQEAWVKGERVILNLVNKGHTFTSNPSIAFYYSFPKRVARKRILFQLAEIGLGFIPISDFIKDNVESFISSCYEEQALTEGALAAHFAMVKDGEMKDRILFQGLNPFLTW
ncbi:MAG: hypothetical protein OXB88_04795 [Bacteriovoracales bacterium]|nr:hypothetical protein [Bacteriovoracales bacterium]